jgi:1,2-diacylglycerol 3-beta-galactosyltransferase
MATTSPVKRILILTTVTGGGHKTAARAIAEQLAARYGNDVTIEIVDVLKDYAPLPFDRAPEAYQIMQKMPLAWRSLYELSDGARRAKIITATLALYTRRQAEKLLERHISDVIISTFHLANAPILEALSHQTPRVPFITVVTDLVTAPAVWFDSRIDLCVIPTEDVRPLAIEGGVRPERIQYLGMPVPSDFKPAKHSSRSILKKALGWEPHQPAVMIMSGADGVGPLEQLARALSPLNCTVAVVTGKNKNLKAEIEHQALPSNVKVYGYVEDMPGLMQAADVLVSKAGAATVMEALNSHLPIVFYAKLSGQEDGNVDFVVRAGAGFWAPKTNEVLSTVSQLVENPAELDRAQTACARISQPAAAQQIADAVGKMLKLTK